MSYEQAVAQLYALGHELAHVTSEHFNLAHMRAVLQRLEHPERRFRSVLIAGTNGKGSTAATLASILQAAGHRTGLYTSPHLLRINERTRVGGEEISDADFVFAHQQVEAAATALLEAGALPWHPSFFEILTGMAFLHFARSGVELAVLEVGMGGRLDATNVVEPVVSVITDIALDHQNFLGHTLREIAAEKVGIIHSGGVVVTLPQHPDANEVIANTAAERGAELVSAAAYVPAVRPDTPCGDSYGLHVFGEQIRVESPLIGHHQVRNVALAIAAAVELNRAGVRISAADVETGIRQTCWPGRFQVIGGEPEMVFDVAHNPAGAWALRYALSQRYQGRPLLLVFGAMRDKAIAEMAEILFPLAERVVATRAENPRSATPEEVQQMAARTGTEIQAAATVAEAVTQVRAAAPAGAVVVITGSTYVVGEAIRALADK